MGRAEAIERIQANLQRLTEEELERLVMVTSEWATPAETFELTDEERAGIERSREDFKAGRTYSLDEAFAFLAARRAARVGQ